MDALSLPLMDSNFSCRTEPWEWVDDDGTLPEPPSDRRQARSTRTVLFFFGH